MKKVIDNKTRGKAIGFLIWFRSQYQVWTNDTYYKIAEKYGQCNYGTCPVSYTHLTLPTIA